MDRIVKKLLKLVSILGFISLSGLKLYATIEYGADVNPTGNPIGGGAGYSNIIDPAAANYFVSTKDELLQALRIATAGQIIYIKDSAEIELTLETDLLIPAGIILASGRGRNGSSGALLYDNSRADHTLFITTGTVRVTGLRLCGPNQLTGGEFKAIGLNANKPGLEVDNCEIYGWPHAAVSANATGDNDVVVSPDIRVHHNYIHHNMRDGLGYGVVLNNGSALVEANRMDYNRHCIAGTGSDATYLKCDSYEARYNIIGPYGNQNAYLNMHGGNNYHDPDRPAGKKILIHHNTFLTPVDPTIRAVVIQGVPSESCEVYRNWAKYDPAQRSSAWVFTQSLNLIYLTPYINMTVSDNHISYLLPGSPVLSSMQDPVVNINENLQFTVSATDHEGDSIVYSAGNLPQGAVFDPGTHLFSWTPTSSQAGTHHNIRFRATENTADALYDEKEISIVVIDPGNHAPDLNVIGTKRVVEGDILRFIVSATDLDGDALSYAVSEQLPGATFDTKTGIFEWRPTYKQSGTYTVRFSVSDGRITDYEDVAITVENVPGYMVARWPLDGTGGDESEYGQSGAMTGPTWVAGKYIKALSFSGDDYMAIENSESLNITGEISIGLWINPSVSQEGAFNGPGIMAKAEKNVGWSWQLKYGEYLGFQFNDPAAGSKWVSVKQTLSPGTWYHVAAIYDGRDLVCYLNGEEKDRIPLSGITASVARLFIGQDGSGNYFKGKIDEVTIWKRAWSVQELSDLYSHNSLPSLNHPPVLRTIGNRSVVAGQLLSFTVSGYDLDETTISLCALNLPPGTIFNTQTGVFTWLPEFTREGVYQGIEFQASDGSLYDSEVISITVLPSNNQNDHGTTVTIPDGTFTGDTPALNITVLSSEMHKYLPSAESALKPMDIFRRIEFADGTKTFTNPLTITISYPDANNDGIVDGTAIKEEDIYPFYLSELTWNWIKIPGRTVDTQNNTVSFQVDHLTIFALMAYAPGADLGHVIVYPNPYKPNSGPGHDRITFDGLSKGTVRIKIYTLAGELIKEIEETAATGQIEWNGKTESGKNAASGVYFYLITNDAGQKAKGKLVIIR